MTTIQRTEEIVIERKVFVSCSCDKCGRTLAEGYADRPYERRDFVLKIETGEQYPDSGTGEGWRINDLCDTCLIELRSLLINAGFIIEDYVWSY